MMGTDLSSHFGATLTFCRSALATSICLSLYGGDANAISLLVGGTFTHYDSTGNPSGFVDTGVTAHFDLTGGTGNIHSSIPFQGSNWSADVDAMYFYDSYGGGTQNFVYTWTNKVVNTTSGIANCRTGVTLDGCAGVTGQLLTSTTNSYSFQMTNAGQFGLGLFFDWSLYEDIPMLSVLQVADDPSDGTFRIFSVDSDGDGVPGTAMKTEPFLGHTADLQLGLIMPIPATLWLFGSGLLGLLGVSRRKKAA